MHAEAGTTNRMLIVDDNEMNRETLKSFFEGRFKIYEAENGQEAFNVLGDNNIDIILLDLNMPIMNGEEFLKAKNADKRYQGIPVVITTAEDSPKQQQTMLSLNANDYIVSPFIRETIIRRVDNVLESDKYFKDVISKHSNPNNVVNDYTTGIYNRSTGERLINFMAAEQIGMYSFMIIEMNGFGKIIEENGTQYADRMLFELAQLLTSMFRTNDIVARIGDDRIGVLMSNIGSEETVESKCHQITDKVSTLDLKLTEAYLSCTIGAVIYKEPARFDDMLKKAEQVLEQTKKDGASWAVSS